MFAHEYLLDFSLITGRGHWNVIFTIFLALFYQVRSIDYNNNYIQSLLLYYGHQNIIFGLEDEKKKMEDEKNLKFQHCGLKLAGFPKRVFLTFSPYLFH